MRIYKRIVVCTLTILLSACIGGIDTGGGGGGGGGGGDVGAPTLQLFPGDAQIVLTWTPDPTNPGDTYQLNRDAVGIYSGSATAYNDLGLTNGQRYCYTVSAVTGENVATSAQVCGTPLSGTVLTITNQSLAAALAWDAVEGAISYNLYLDGSFVSPSLSKGIGKADSDDGDLLFATVAAPNTTYDWTGYYDRDGTWVPLSNNCVEYPVIIKAVDIDGNEGPASTQTAEPDTEGTLDTTFATDGALTVVGATNGTFYGLAVLEDDTIVGLVNGDNSILVGYPDNVGAAMTPLWSIWFEATMDTVLAMTVDEDENIYVAGSDSGNAKVCRFVRDGDDYVIDSAGFGTGGCYEFVSVDNTVARAITLDSQGRIIMGGQTGIVLSEEFTVWRVLADGSGLDGTFLANGLALMIDVTDNWEYVSSVTMIYSDTDEEKIFATLKSQDGGGTNDGYYLFFDEVGTVGGFLNLSPLSGGVTDAVALTDYTLLTLFYDTLAAPGVYIQDVNVEPIKVNFTYFYEESPVNDEDANKIALDCHDRAVVAGTATAAGDVMAFRTDEAFAIDASFAASGWYVYPSPLGWGGDGFAIAFDNRGRILVGGRLSTFVSTSPVIIRLQ